MVVSTGMGRRESRFYAEVASELPIRVPQPIWAGWNDDGSSYLMLIEDLAEAGCTFPSFRVDDAGEHARGMMDTLADLHGRYWDTSRFADDLAWIERRRELERPLLQRYLARLTAAGVEPPRFDDAWHELRRHAVTSWIAATVTAAAGSRMRSLDVGESAMQRATAAIADYGTPTLLRGELGL